MLHTSYIVILCYVTEEVCYQLLEVAFSSLWDVFRMSAHQRHRRDVTQNHVTQNHVTQNHVTQNHVTQKHVTSCHATGKDDDVPGPPYRKCMT